MPDLLKKMFLNGGLGYNVLNFAMRAAMKVLMAQLNTTVGDLDGNASLILNALRKGKELGAQLVIFPELMLAGYPPRDLVEKKSFVDANLKKLEEVAKATDGIAAIVGFVDRNPSQVGNRVFNAAAYLEGGRIKSIHHKTLLPTYDVFDEGRYFEPSQTTDLATISGMKAGISICEDAWNDEDFWQHRMYRRDPIREQVEMGAEILINISASPFSIGKPLLREKMLSSQAAKYKKTILIVNLLGGNDELIFDGHSYVFAPDGTIAFEGRSFEEDLLLVDLAKPLPRAARSTSDEMGEIYKALVLGTRDYMRKCGFSKCVIGMSGGMDSSVVAVLASHAVGPGNVLGIMMPSQFTSRQSIEDAEALMRNLGMQGVTVPIQKSVESYKESLAPLFQKLPEDVTEENIQARIRGNILMAVSNKYGHLVITTGNKSEIAVGYCTLYGDMSGGLAIISDVPKTMVYRLARYINRDKEIIPERVFTKAPSAELRPDQTDQDTLPPYEVLDPILKLYVEERKSVREILALGYPEETVKKIVGMVDRNEYKRKQAPPGLKISTKAFGVGRRMPIAQRFREI